jgi:hypothetical protein
VRVDTHSGAADLDQRNAGFEVSTTTVDVSSRRGVADRCPWPCPMDFLMT